MKLFIVESPAKAKTIRSYLGKDFVVIATMGHIKDLPSNEMGIDFRTFEPKYVFLPGKRKIISSIINLSKKSDIVFLASDRDREGEMISFHVKEVISRYVNQIKRVEFIEVTKDGILSALSSPRDINYDLVNAQKTRRLLDRIVGYVLSPVLFRNFRTKYRGYSFSAGRVQSPALRLVCEREIEIRNFVSVPYYDVFIECEKDSKQFLLKLVSEHVDDNKLKFGLTNRIDDSKLDEIKENLNFSNIKVLYSKFYRDFIKPLPPFKTSTLQQEASAKLGFSPSKTMNIAQQLYEGMDIGGEFVGLITYMRTDSVRISDYAIKRVREFIKTKLGDNYLPKNPRIYDFSNGNIQDAHECIRPTDVFREPISLKDRIPESHYLLYDLIWRRFIASQMKDAVLSVIEVLASDGRYNFAGVSRSVVEENFLRFYPHSVPDEFFLPLLEDGEKLNVVRLVYNKKRTQHPPRYTEATLIKKLEEEGIGRPSTYATIVSTLLTRKYVVKKGKSLVPTELGFDVYYFLKENYPNVVDLKLTSYMESMLDEIEEGKVRDWKGILKRLVEMINIPI
ncbi:MAG: type I DNA topoisomerase [Brevinematia bacterium]